MIRQRLLTLSLAAAIAAGGTGSALVTTAAAARPTNVVLAPPTVKPGHHCAKGVSGCTRGTFTGNFFGD